MSLFDPKDFRSRKKTVIQNFEKKGVTSGSIAEYAALAGVPITVICTFIMEEMPEHEELCNEKIRQINEFFGY